MRSFFLSILLCTSYLVNAQTLDELKLAIKKDTSVINTINNTLKLSAVFSRSNIDSALFYAEEAIKISNNADEKLLTKSLMHKGTFLSLKGNFIAGDSILTSNFARPTDSTTLGLSHINLANSYQIQKRFDEAITHYLKASEIFEAKENKIRLAQIYLNIGVLNARNKNLNKAIKYLNKASENANENEMLTLQIQINLSSVYVDKNNYSDGLKFSLLAEELAIKNQFKRGLGTIYTNLCKIYNNSDSLKNPKKGIDYGLQALRIKNEIGNIPAFGITLNNIGQAYLEEKKYSNATRYLNDALDNSTGDLKAIVLNNLKTLHSKTGNNKLALEYSDRLIKYKDSLATSKQQERVTEIIERYESEKKQQQIDVLNIKNELQQSKLDGQRNLFIGLGLFSFLLLLLTYFWFNNKKTKQSLRQTSLQHKLLQTQLNPHFLFHSLNSIESFIHQNKKEESSSYLISYSKLMRSILESSDQDFISIEEDFNAIKGYVKLQKLNLKKEIQISFECEDNIEAYKIPPMFIQPYVENSLLHGVSGVENGKVSIFYKNIDTNIQVIIADNGKGLTQKKNNIELHRSMSGEIINQRIQNLKKVHNYNVNIVTESNENGTKIILNFPKKI